MHVKILRTYYIHFKFWLGIWNKSSVQFSSILFHIGGQQYNLWKFKDTDRINTDQYNLKQLMYDKSYDIQITWVELGGTPILV